MNETQRPTAKSQPIYIFDGSLEKVQLLINRWNDEYLNRDGTIYEYLELSYVGDNELILFGIREENAAEKMYRELKEKKAHEYNKETRRKQYELLKKEFEE